jgi:hyperosmotically inducible periplasmic protein
MKSAIFGLVCGIALIAGPVSAGPVEAQSAAVTVTDDTLDERIETRVRQDADLKNHDVNVSVDNGVATLTGTVATNAQKTRAATLARMNGITRVDNKIVVDAKHVGTKGTVESTKEAARETKEAAKEVGKATKEVSKDVAEKTKDGAVVVAEKTKDGAVVVAEKTKEGASKVGSEITDAWILSRVKSRFVGEDVLKGHDINVDCDQKVVTLRGTVPTAAARARAMEIARATEGVQKVNDQLTIGLKK